VSEQLEVWKRLLWSVLSRYSSHTHRSFYNNITLPVGGLSHAPIPC
jgi:hypothetical protein